MVDHAHDLYYSCMYTKYNVSLQLIRIRIDPLPDIKQVTISHYKKTVLELHLILSITY